MLDSLARAQLRGMAKEAKPPADVNRKAKAIVDLATGQKDETPLSPLGLRQRSNRAV